MDLWLGGDTGLVGVNGMTKKILSSKLGIDNTLDELSLRYETPKSAFVLLLIIYVIASFFVSLSATRQGIVVMFGKSVPFSSFSGVFSALANLCIIFLVFLFRKSGYITAMFILCLFQLPMLVFQFFMRNNVNGIAGIFSNLFTVVTVTIIYLMNDRSMKYQQKLYHQSVTDRLTKLPNRFAATEVMDQLIKDDTKFTIVTIDINNFKAINDTMGHEFGDKVLIEVANRWKALADSGRSGTNDFVTRLGGDEYSLIIRGYKDEENIINTIITYKEELEKMVTIDECDYYITAHFGYAEYPEDATDVDTLLSGANAALHELNRAGSGVMLRFTPELHRNERKLELERRIRNALDNNLVTFNLQPQYNLKHQLVGFEALARMKDEDGKFISPAEFIPVAEETGLVDRIDTRVFALAAEFLSEVRSRKADSELTISTNVSVRHLMKNNFIDETRSIIDRYGIPAEKIEIEITESIMIDSTDKALDCINELKSMGIKIAIDDFGTGYSSLSYLNNLPSDYLKIDKSFIDVMNDSDSTKKYVATIISIGHILHLEVISEGVESDEQIETLRSVGCDYIQGFVWGRPMPPEEAMELAMSA